MALSEDLNPFWISEKQNHLIYAVQQNDVNLLNVLLDSPIWYNTTDNWGCNLLQIAVLLERKEVFDYLLSLPDYPLEFENPRGRTALEESLYDCWTRKNEYFACELIKKGASINKICNQGDTLLHYACNRGFLNASKLLIEKGIDVNICGSNNLTPLESLCKCNPYDIKNYDEIFIMLLEFGAYSSVRNETEFTPFENSVTSGNLGVVEEAFVLLHL